MGKDADKIEILLAEDEAPIRDALVIALEGVGYAVRAVANGREVVEAFTVQRPDLVLLDVLMPQMGGYEACGIIRGLDREVPILFLSCLDSEVDQIKGLELGADDYVSKTSSTEMLIARVKSAIARSKRLATMSDVPPSLTRTEANIYRLLRSERGRLFSYREIFAAIFGAGYYADEGALRSHISHLRGKLPPGETIEAKRGRGFCLQIS